MLCWCIPDDTGICTGMFELRNTIRDHGVLLFTWWYRYMYRCVWIKEHYQRSCCVDVYQMIQVHVQVCLNKGALSEIMLCCCLSEDTGICTGVFELRTTIRYHVVLLFIWWHRYMYRCVIIKEHYQRSCCVGVYLMTQVHIQVCLN